MTSCKSSRPTCDRSPDGRTSAIAGRRPPAPSRPISPAHEVHVSHSPLDAFPVTIHVPILWGDMDAYGHVNNTVFFRLFEAARIAYLEECGFIASYEQDRVGAILHSTECRFRRPLFYPDTVVVGARVREMADDRFTMEYVIVSQQHDGAVAGEGTGVIVSYDYAAGRKTPLPEAIRDRVTALEGRSPAGT
jgi:acyl-CoA thioester hydrolase